MRLRDTLFIRRPATLFLFVTAFLTLPTYVPALTLRVSDAGATYGPVTKDPCPRGDDNDLCSVTGYFHAETVQSNAADIYNQAWKNWNNALPEDERWTLVDGGDLEGEIDVTLFRTRNDCPGTGGVEVDAYFRPANGGDVWWKWSQGLHDNYNAGPAPPHNSQAPAAKYEMDVNTSGDNNPPLYPYSYSDGDFYDKPGAVCLHNQTVFFDAICLISKADYKERKLTTYRGFEYGFDFTCTHVAVPEPASMAMVGIGLAALALRRRRKL